MIAILLFGIEISMRKPCASDDEPGLWTTTRVARAKTMERAGREAGRMRRRDGAPP
jgi:hypothetical protein